MRSEYFDRRQGYRTTQTNDDFRAVQAVKNKGATYKWYDAPLVSYLWNKLGVIGFSYFESLKTFHIFASVGFNQEHQTLDGLITQNLRIHVRIKESSVA